MNAGATKCVRPRDAKHVEAEAYEQHHNTTLAHSQLLECDKLETWHRRDCPSDQCVPRHRPGRPAMVVERQVRLDQWSGREDFGSRPR